jgi:DNA replication and repair protein RecF
LVTFATSNCLKYSVVSIKYQDEKNATILKAGNLYTIYLILNTNPKIVFLNKISLYNFKNHEALSLHFDKKLNCIIGNNGVGKTNLLDAIYYLCLTKSYFNNTDQQNILFNQNFFRLEGSFIRQGEKFELVYKLPANKRKELTVNDAPVPRLSDHVGNFPVIIITPDDSQLITGSSEERRRFIDNTISQVNHDYLEQLLLYHKVIAQRNAALKRFAETGKTDKALIESYDNQLVPAGMKIYEARKLSIEKLYPAFLRFYKEISFEREMVSFSYSSQLSEKPFDELLKDNFNRDLLLQRTEVGIHKDDIEFIITPKSPNGDLNANTKLKKFGSQGQQKSFIISIKFAQYDFIRQNKNFNPLLLIDDIFDKLDNDRSQKLVELIASDHFGQVFLSDTDDAHIRQVLAGKEPLFNIVKIGA